jgi:hypothetical protein
MAENPSVTGKGSAGGHTQPEVLSHRISRVIKAAAAPPSKIAASAQGDVAFRRRSD